MIMKPSGIGGQAVIEGVMMKNQSNYAVAVRKPDGDIEVSKDIFVGLGDRIPVFRIPFLRGIGAFIDSLVLGMKTLSFSAGYYEEEGTEAKNTGNSSKNSGSSKKAVKAESASSVTKESSDEIVVREWRDPTLDAESDGTNGKSSTVVKEGLNKSKAGQSRKESVAMALTMVLSFVLAISIFVVVPFVLSELFSDKVTSYGIRSLIEGGIRLFLFILYILLISLMQDIKRVFMYHGAEHKVINCIEKGYELDVDNAKKQTKEHKRCGTSFLLYVVLISIIVFVFIKVDVMWLRMLLRILLVPAIAGIAYEFIRFAGRSNNIIINILSKPGLWLQGLTTREPDDAMLEVAIASVDAVFDWRTYLETGRRYDYRRSRFRKRDKLETAGVASVETDKSEKTTEVKDIIEEKPAVDISVDTSVGLEESTTDSSLDGIANLEDILPEKEEETDEILKALDKYFVMEKKEDKS